jgi:hypothetical protein
MRRRVRGRTLNKHLQKSKVSSGGRGWVSFLESVHSGAGAFDGGRVDIDSSLEDGIIQG